MIKKNFSHLDEQTKLDWPKTIDFKSAFFLAIKGNPIIWQVKHLTVQCDNLHVLDDAELCPMLPKQIFWITLLFLLFFFFK